jgi:hypothetical protein
LFDHEGTTSNTISIGMRDIKIVKEVKKLVKTMGIETSKLTFGSNNFGGGCYYFRIPEREVQKFKDEIGFYHPIKLKRLNTKLKIKERNKTQRTRPLDWTRNKIIGLLKEKSMTTTKISDKLLLSTGGLRHHLKFLEDCKKIKRDGYKNKILWSLKNV